MNQRAIDIPRAPEELTPAFLTEALGARHLHRARVTAFDTERLSEGVGFIGVVARLRLRYDCDVPAAPASVIAKFPSPDEGARAIGNLYGLYEREVHFYEDLAPSVSLRTPACYYAAWDASAGGRCIVLLEDMAATGAIGDQLAGCSDDQALAVIAEMARFHAAWWDSPRLGEVAWLQSGADLVRGAMTHVYDACRQPFMETFGHHLTPPIREIVPSLNQRVVSMIEGFEDGPLTLVHGDFRLDNIFFAREGSASDYGIAVCDWQSPNRGWGTYDLSYFVSGSLPPTRRRAIERDLLAEYHGALVQGGVTGYSVEQLTDDYRRSLLAYLAIFVVNGATLERSNQRAVELFAVIFDRLVAAISDLDALAFLRA